MKAIRSRAYLDGSRGASCKLRLPGCDGGGETTVACHVRDSHTGGAIKASDLSVIDGCVSCHAIFDRQRTFDGKLLSQEDWLFYALRGLQETLEARVELGLLIVKGAK